MNKYFIYCRKSSEQEDRQILSLPAQENELIAYAKRENLEIVATYKESMSAHKIGRPLFNDMLQKLEQGKADGIVVWDESRLARNAKDSGNLIYMIDLGQVKEIRKPGKVYKNVPDDKSWLAMCFMMSKKESDDKGVNVARGLRTKALQGWFPSSWTKPGYVWDRMAERGNKTIIDDPIRFRLIKRAWEYFLSGAYTVAEIHRLLNEEWGYRTLTRKSIGGNKMSKSQIYKIFSDPFYYGEYEYPSGSGNWQKGLHSPMITKEQFIEAQVRLGRKGQRHLIKHDFPLTGLIRCGECTAMITAEEKWQMICSQCKYKFASHNKDACPKCGIMLEDMTKPTLLHYTYYHCTKRKNPNCTQKSIQSEELEYKIDDLLKGITISERFKEWAIKYLSELNEGEISTHEVEVTALQQAHKACLEKVDNLVRLYISPSNTTGEIMAENEFKERKTALMKERKELEERIAQNGSAIENWVEDVEQKFSFATSARYRFSTGSAQVKREILTSIGSNLTLEDKNVRINWETAYGFIEKLVVEEPSISAMFEPIKEIDIAVQIEDLWSKNSNLLPLVDMFRNREIKIDISLENIKVVYSALGL